MASTSTVTFGDELRRWRTARRLSQLDLAVAAEVSQRHVSFLETGRSKPSPEMVVHLGGVLDMSLRDQNALLAAEDRNFFQHAGVDAEGVLRAVLRNVVQGRNIGGSTLTSRNRPAANRIVIDRIAKR